MVVRVNGKWNSVGDRGGCGIAFGRGKEGNGRIGRVCG